MAIIGEMGVNVVARTSKLTSGLNRARKEMGLFSASLMKLRNSLLLVSAGFAALRFGNAVVRATAEMEQLIAQFKVLTGELGKAEALYGQLRDMAATTPLQLDQLAQAGRTLMLFGIQANQVEKTLRMLGDAAGGNAVQLKFMVRAYGQVSSLGRLQGQDLLQLINAGWNPLQQVIERTGETMAEARERMEEGRISFKEIRQALEDATGPGGRFFGMMEEMSKTLTGRWTTFSDIMKENLRQIGEILLPALKKVMESLINIAKWWKGISVETKRNIVFVSMLATTIAAIAVSVRTILFISQLWRGVLVAIAAIKSFIAVLDGKAALLPAAIAAAVVVGGSLSFLMSLMSDEADEHTKQIEKQNEKIKEQNRLLQEQQNIIKRTKIGGDKFTPFESVEGRVAYENYMEQIRGGRPSVSVVGGNEDGTDRIVNAIDDTTDAVRESGTVGMAGGL